MVVLSFRAWWGTTINYARLSWKFPKHLLSGSFCLAEWMWGENTHTDSGELRWGIARCGVAEHARPAGTRDSRDFPGTSFSYSFISASFVLWLNSNRVCVVSSCQRWTSGISHTGGLIVQDYVSCCVVMSFFFVPMEEEVIVSCCFLATVLTDRWSTCHLLWTRSYF